MFRAPRQLPHFQTLLDDLPGSTEQIARMLDIHAGTLRRYRHDGQAPRAVMLAMFWESRWGLSQINAHATNSAILHAQHAASLQRQCEHLRSQIRKLEIALDQPRAANAPIFAY